MPGGRDADFPGALMPLFRDSRYKILYGGRGGGKSWGIATYLLAEAARRPLRVLCCREFQASIRESVHRLLADMIHSHGLDERFEVLVNSIKSAKGSEFIFEGLRHNVGRIRSLEGIDKVWVEEASNVSRSSWEVLIPTIRKDGSEIIVSFNPELESDETYQRFVAKPPRDAVLMKVNYHDNPWFPEVLRKEMEDLRARDPDAYQHVYLGECRLTLDGAIYAKELREATEEGRIATVPYDTTKPVSVYCDLGWQDLTAIWFVQHIAGEVRLIDYLEDSQRPFNDYLKEMQSRPYLYQTLWLPHDAQAKSLGTGRSIEEIARAAGWRVRIVPKLSVADGINAVRTLFPNFWFDRERCSDGVQALRHYRYDLDPNGQFSRQPLHDQASHCLVGETDVLTRYGMCQIKDLPDIGEILTPCGWKPYHSPRITRRNAPLAEVRFSGGYTVKCTPDHLFLTESGWKSASDLRPTSRIRSSLTLSRSISMASFIAFGRAKNILCQASASIARSGKLLSAKFQRVVISTTKITIHATMLFPTWNAFQLASISLITGTEPGTPFAVGKDQTVSGSNTFRRMRDGLLPNGMVPRKDAFGIGVMPETQKDGKSSSGLRSLARSVGQLFRLWFGAVLTHKNIAPRYARRALGASVTISDEIADVWCLTVPDAGCFTLGNGAVVHNCADALRYVAVAMAEARRAQYPTTPRPKRMTVEPRQRANTAWMRV